MLEKRMCLFFCSTLLLSLDRPKNTMISLCIQTYRVMQDVEAFDIYIVHCLLA